MHAAVAAPDFFRKSLRELSLLTIFNFAKDGSRFLRSRQLPTGWHEANTSRVGSVPNSGGELIVANMKQ